MKNFMIHTKKQNCYPLHFVIIFPFTKYYIFNKYIESIKKGTFT